MTTRDWNTVVLNNTKYNRTINTTNNVNNNVIKKVNQPNKQRNDIKIKDEDGEIPKIKTVNLDMSKSISDARVKKGWSQLELAQKINEKVDIVRSYESGSAIYNSKILSKIKKVLNI
jgi:ribosome-binding protein aMBF1 (putative translation factor)